jgi:hypothetical protein
MKSDLEGINRHQKCIRDSHLRDVMHKTRWLHDSGDSEKLATTVTSCATPNYHTPKFESIDLSRYLTMNLLLLSLVLANSQPPHDHWADVFH